VPRSIRAPFAAVLAVGVAAASLLAAFIIGDVYETTVEAAGADSIQVTQSMFAALQRSDVKKMDATLEALLADQGLAAHFMAGDRPRLLAAALPRFAGLRDRDGITHWYFIGVDRKTFLRVHRPELHGDLIDRVTLQRAAETGTLASGLELGQTAFALRVVRPWYVGGKLIGFMELAEEIGHFLVRMKADTGNDFAVLVRKQFLDESAWRRINGPARDTWNSRPDVVVVDTTNYGDGLVDFQGEIGTIPPGGLVLGEETEGARAWIRGIFPFFDAKDRQVGALVVARDYTSLHDAMRRGRLRVMLVVLGMSFVASLVVWFAADRLIFHRLAQAIGDAERAAGLGGAEPGAEGHLGRIRRIGERAGLHRDERGGG
jgi:Double sensory domain of two-component sensor kinase